MKMNPLAKQKNSLFNFKSFNELKKDQTKIKIFKNSSFDSSFNSVQSLNTNLSHLLRSDCASQIPFSKPDLGEIAAGPKSPKGRGVGSYPKISAILRAIRSIRLNRDEWKLIRYLNQMKKKIKIKSNPTFERPSLKTSAPIPPSLRGSLLPKGAAYDLASISFTNSTSYTLSLPNNLSLSSGEGQPSLLEGESKGVDSTSLLLGKESNLKSYIFKKFKNKKEGVANARGGIFTKLNPKERKKLRKLRKEFKKFASLLSPVVRWLESPLLNRVAPSRQPRLSLLLREGGRTKEISKKAATTLKKLKKKNKAFAAAEREDNKYNYLKQLIYKFKETQIREGSYKKIFSYNNIISKNILLRNMKFNFLKSILSTILKKRIRLMSEILEDKPIKHYSLYSYLKFCIFSPPHLKGGRTKLSLNKYKGRKLGSFIKYNKIISYNFNSTAPSVATQHPAISNSSYPKEGIANIRGNIYIKDTYKLLFYLFKSMYCLISKPVLNYTNDKVTIQLFYYLNIPKKKVFRLFSISYINSIKKKWLAPPRAPLLPKGWKDGLYPTRPDGLREKEASQIFTGGWAFLATLLKPKPEGSNKPLYPSPFHGRRLARGGRGNPKIYIRWKLRKAISRLKFKIITALGPGPLRVGGGGKNLLFNLRKFNLTKVYQNKFKLICAILSKKFNKPVELQLIRLHHPYHDSNILVNLLSLNIKNKRKKARVAIQKIYNKKPVKNLNDPNLKKTALPTAESLARGTGKLIPAFLSGLNIKIAGRLMGEPIIPRITTKVYGKGATATGKVNYLDVAKITKKNRKGAYTIKITSGQNFF